VTSGGNNIIGGSRFPVVKPTDILRDTVGQVGDAVQRSVRNGILIAGPDTLKCPIDDVSTSVTSRMAISAVQTVTEHVAPTNILQFPPITHLGSDVMGNLQNVFSVSKDYALASPIESQCCDHLLVSQTTDTTDDVADMVGESVVFSSVNN